MESRIGWSSRVGIGAALAFLGLLLQVALLSRYSSGPEAILLVPGAAAIYLGLGTAAVLLLGIVRRQRAAIAVVVSCAAAILLDVSILHPTDGKITPFRYATMLLKDAAAFHSIEYADAYGEGPESGPLALLARSKFCSRLPEEAIVVHYYASTDVAWNDRTRFAFERRGDHWDMLDLTGRGPPASLTERVSDGRRLFVLDVGGEHFELTRAQYGNGLLPASGDLRLVPGRPNVTVFFARPERR